MSEMIERIATALEPKCRAFGSGDMPMAVAREFARTALEAMCEPDDAMRLASKRYKRKAKVYSGPQCYREMIEAALKP
ncbi:hypothetical protein EN816_00950 [Mesorhizobium sp. M8A.F.Ca.ET.173.01.1.1]|nr:hypothetical protein EN816_00950 [Mesorhizobium sp. M8A.F.Ca.ET.173.01.1.1]